MLWEVDIYPARGLSDRTGSAVAAAAAELGLADGLRVAAAHGYLIEGPLDERARHAHRSRTAGRQRRRASRGGRRSAIRGWSIPRAAELADVALAGAWQVVHVLPKPGVMDPVAQSALAAIADLGLQADAVRTLRKYWIAGLPTTSGWRRLCRKVLANDAIEQVIVGPLRVRAARARLALRVSSWSRCRCARWTTTALERLSREGQLYLSLVEMQTIQAHFRQLGPRSDRRRTGDDRPDLERALQPQDAGRADRLPRRRRASGGSRTCSRRRSSPPRDEIRRAAGRRRLVRERVRRQRRRGPLRRPVQRRVQGRNAQPSLGPGALRRGQHGHRRRDPRSDGHRHGRQADLQHRRLLLRPARHAGRRRCRPACCIRAA